MSVSIKNKVGIKGKVTLSLAPESVAGTPATGTVVVSNNGVIEVIITDPGSGYTNVPTVTISGDGSGATGEAIIKDGAVIAVYIRNPGSGYNSGSVTIEGPDTASIPLPGPLRTLEECSIVLNSPGDRDNNYFNRMNGFAWNNDNGKTLPINPTITANTGNCSLYPNQEVIVIKVFTGPFAPGAGGDDYGYNTGGSGSNYRRGPQPVGWNVSETSPGANDFVASTTHFSLDYYNAAGTLLDTVTSSINGDDEDAFDNVALYGHWKAPTAYHYMVLRGEQVSGGDVNFINIMWSPEDPNDE